MKKLFAALMLFAVANAALALTHEELDNRINALAAKLDEMQRKPDKAIPADLLAKAQGIILLEKVKGGLVFGYEGGHGIAMVREGRTHRWSPAAFMASSASSFGLQAGGEQNFFVILVMNTNSTRLMTEPNFDFGGEARGTAGNSHGGAESTINSDEAPVLIYSDRTGFYNGAVVKGGTLSPDKDANQVYYGDFYTMRDILMDHKVKATQDAINLGKKLNEFSRKPRN
jgi:lipid-binding SYLF domain-containing protein